jgi:eukaryotic translation initiation factor 2C
MVAGPNMVKESFGTSVVPKLITVPGRVLACPSVKYFGNKSVTPAFGSWNMANIQFVSKATLQDWTFLYITNSDDRVYDEAWLKATMISFTAALKSMGINASMCSRGKQLTLSGQPGSQEAEIDQAINELCGRRPKPKLILVLLPSTDAVVYNRVKYACDVREGVINVCVLTTNFGRGNVQYFANVALKVNLKLGGRNQSLESTKLGIIAEGKTMVVGIDVTHPAPGSASNSPSVASIVASVDQHLGQWPADLRIQTGREEMVLDLEGLFKSRLRLWQSKNRGAYPENILVYRDGVSEGQYALVLTTELPSLRKACAALYPASQTALGLPRISIIVVGKRHNARFYATTDMDRSGNPFCGTVVDRGVTEARNWDFYLQSHTSLQGTARPAHYYVVYDEIFQAKRKAPSMASFEHAADALQDLTHNLCYMYGRATKAVSICPPAYYADLACDRARCYLSGVYDPSPSTTQMGSVTSGGGGEQQVDAGMVRIHENVKDTMFYI